MEVAILTSFQETLAQLDTHKPRKAQPKPYTFTIIYTNQIIDLNVKL